MRKFLSVLAFCTLSVTVHADINESKIATIKKVYNSPDSNETMYRLGTPIFKKWYEYQDSIDEVGINYDLSTNSSDLGGIDVAKSVKYSITETGEVKASFKAYGKYPVAIYYTLECNKVKCLIASVR